jgi:hypothetical protein
MTIEGSGRKAGRGEDVRDRNLFAVVAAQHFNRGSANQAPLLLRLISPTPAGSPRGDNTLAVVSSHLQTIRPAGRE